jgi:hypothetical protein
MKNTEHQLKITPKPWVTHYVGQGKSAYVDILQASDTNVVIDTCGPTDEELANGNLLSAAPDLYEACLPVVKYEPFDVSGKWCSVRIQLSDYVAIRSALAKARGKV